MRHIKLVVDDAMFKKFERDKEARKLPSWEDYFEVLFAISKETAVFE